MRRTPVGATSGRGEFALIERHFARASGDASVRTGIGDDAAVLVPAPGHDLVLAVDMMVEGRHFVAGTDPEGLGHKILAVNLSDVAAMGARPRWALLAGALPDDDDAWLAAFSQGLFALARAHGVALVGGDTTRGPRTLCLTIAGDVPAGGAILRSGASPGDDLWVSGTLGDAMLGLAAIEERTSLDPQARAHCVARLERPTPRVALGLALRGVATAMLDVSDGLTGDLRHVLDASRAGAVVELAWLPRIDALDRKLAGRERELALRCLLGGGDDYELLFAAPAGKREAVATAGRSAGVAVTRIGGVVDGDVLVVRDEGGQPLAAPPPAFDHFAADAS
ncbi:MAG: thiamine-phosphate kinase [Betaproteobacteria bacterium]